MPKIDVHAVLRFVLGSAVAGVFAVSPQLAQAQAPGSLTQLTGSNACIQATNIAEGGDCPNSTAQGLSGSTDVAVTPDGKDAYVVSSNDGAITEFSRGTDGSLTPIGCIADQTAEGAHATTPAASG